MSGPDLLAHRRRPAEGGAEGMLVLFHGRGTDEHDLFPLLDVLDPDRRLLGVTPRGPLQMPPGGNHWYLVREIGYPDRVTFATTLDTVTEWLAALAQETGIPPARTVIGGFSQGAVMAYALGLGRRHPGWAGMVALSGFIPNVDGFEVDLGTPPPPVAIGHGTHDPVIGVDFSRQARRLIEAAGGRVLYRESSMAHSVDPTFLAEIQPWLQPLLPARAEA